MSGESHGFKNTASLADPGFSDVLEANVREWLRWSFLAAGGWFDVRAPHPGARLRPVGDEEADHDYSGVFPSSSPVSSPGSGYRIWRSRRSDWVWESDTPPLPVGPPPPGSGGPLAYAGPLIASGVRVDGVFLPCSRGHGSGYRIDWRGGRVIFDDPLPSGSVVECEHSFRTPRVLSGDDECERFRELLWDSLAAAEGSPADPPRFGGPDRGIELPALLVEAVPRFAMKPLQIGSTARVHEQDVLVRVLTENARDRRRLTDVVAEQWDRILPFFDKGAVDSADAWPIAADGTLRDEDSSPVPPESGTFPSLCERFPWRTSRITAVRGQDGPDTPTPLRVGICRMTFETDLP